MISQQVALKGDAVFKLLTEGKKLPPQLYADVYAQASNGILKAAGFPNNAASDIAYQLAKYFTEDNFQKSFAMQSVETRESIKDNLFTTIATLDPAALQHITTYEHLTSIKDQTPEDYNTFRKLLQSVGDKDAFKLDNQKKTADINLSAATLSVWMVGALRELLPVGNKLNDPVVVKKIANSLTRSFSSALGTAGKVGKSMKDTATSVLRIIENDLQDPINQSLPPEVKKYRPTVEKFIQTSWTSISQWNGLLPIISFGSRIAQNTNRDWSKMTDIQKARAVLFPLADVMTLAEWAKNNPGAVRNYQTLLNVSADTLVAGLGAFRQFGNIFPQTASNLNFVTDFNPRSAGNMFNWLAPTTAKLVELAGPVASAGGGLADIVYGSVNFAEGIKKTTTKPTVQSGMLTAYGAVNMLAGINFAAPLFKAGAELMTRGYYKNDNKPLFYAARSGMNIGVQLAAAGMATYFAVDNGKKLEDAKKKP